MPGLVVSVLGTSKSFLGWPCSQAPTDACGTCGAAIASDGGDCGGGGDKEAAEITAISVDIAGFERDKLPSCRRVGEEVWRIGSVVNRDVGDGDRGTCDGDKRGDAAEATTGLADMVGSKCDELLFC